MQMPESPSLTPLVVALVATIAMPVIFLIAYGVGWEHVLACVATVVLMLFVKRSHDKRMYRWRLHAAAYIRQEVDACRMHPNALQMAEEFERQAKESNSVL